MFSLKKNIRFWYTINLIEGEGVGTAYEYYAKLKKLRKFINSVENPKRILIAGLPEKYGLSMDFFLLGQMLDVEIVVIDERFDTLERAKKVLWTLKSKNFFNSLKVMFHKIDHLFEFENENVMEQKFDIALSSEVFQRLDKAKDTYISNLIKVAKNFAIFAPNRGNESHASLSGLNSVRLEELLRHCQKHSEVRIYDYGYIDMPPFPPGLTRSQEKRDQAANSQIETFLMRGLELYSILEDVVPQSIKKQVSHITYVMGNSH